MELNGRVAVITGGSGGIGKAMARAFLDQGARGIVLADLNQEAVDAAAADIGCDGKVCNVTDEAQVQALADFTIERHGQIDLFCSNAGAGGPGVLIDAANEVWQRQWELHVMAHVYAARAVLPAMIERGAMAVFTPWGQSTDTLIPSSPWVMAMNGRTTRPSIMKRAWRVSVRLTARNPPRMVYPRTMAAVMRTPDHWLRPKLAAMAFPPPTNWEET